MVQIAKNIKKQAMFVGFIPSTSYHWCKISPNLHSFCFYFSTKTQNYQKESLINENILNVVKSKLDFVNLCLFSNWCPKGQNLHYTKMLEIIPPTT